jgi:Na+-transporting NADH:ubiquinone oxidoreductase subunit B
VAIGATFAAVIGTHAFGGTGRYLVSPALLGALFLQFSYPELTSTVGPGAMPIETTWSTLAGGGVPEDLSFWLLLLGNERGSIGGASAAACLVGALYLVRRGVVSWRVLTGGVAGVIVASMLGSLMGGADDLIHQMPWYMHLAVGNLAFVLVFIATDPTTGALTPGARWVHGGAVGFFAVLLRVFDTAHPEGTLAAALIAGLMVPLFDHLSLKVELHRIGHARG